MKYCSLTATGRLRSKALQSCCVPVQFGLITLLTAIALPTGVQSQDDTFGFTAVAATRSVKTVQELAEAWADPTIWIAQIQGNLTIDPAYWRERFSATGGVAVLAGGSTRKNFTIAGDPQSPASINFQSLPYIMMVGTGGVLQLHNVQLYDPAQSDVYHYSPEQPYRAIVIGPLLWPSIGLAPGAGVRLTNVSIAFRNPDPVLSCEELTARDIHAVRQLPGKQNMTWRNGTGLEPGARASKLEIVNGSDNTPVGEVSVYKQNVTFVCLPAVSKERLFGKLTASQFAVAVSVPIGVTVAILAVLALCIRRYRRKQPAAHGSSSTVLKDVESGLSQQSGDQSGGVMRSACRRKQLRGSCEADSTGKTSSSTDDADSSDGSRMINYLAQSLSDQQMQLKQPSDSLLHQPTEGPIHLSAAAVTAAAAGSARTSMGQKLAARNEDSAFLDDDAVGVAGYLSDEQRLGDKQCQERRTPLTTGAASPVDTGSKQLSAGASASTSRVSSATLIASSNDNHSQQRQQQSGSLVSAATAPGQPASSSTKSRRLKSDGAGAAAKKAAADDSAFTALLKARSDIAVLGDLKIRQLLGTGSYGRVYKGRWKSVTVAVKIIAHNSTTRSAPSSNGNKLVMAGRETALASSMAHPNVVQTYHISTMTASQRRTLARTCMVSSSTKRHRGGQHRSLQQAWGTIAAEDEYNRHEFASRTHDDEQKDAAMDVTDAEVQKDPLETWLIMEYCELGSLERVVKSGALLYKEGKPDMIGIYKALLDIASGLDYLHSMGVVHGDLKTANVLLKGSRRDVRGFACKITDFGLSRVLEHDATHVSTQTYGTMPYMPKEVLLTGHMSQATDVYSFGLLMWELYAGCSVFNDENMSIGQIFYMIAYSDWRPDIPSDCPSGYSDLMKACWHQNPKERPSARQLLLKLWKQFTEAKQAAATAAKEGISQSAPLPIVMSQRQQQLQGVSLTDNGPKQLAESPDSSTGSSSGEDAQSLQQHLSDTADEPVKASPPCAGGDNPISPVKVGSDRADHLLQQPASNQNGGNPAIPSAAECLSSAELAAGSAAQRVLQQLMAPAAACGPWESQQQQKSGVGELTNNDSQPAKPGTVGHEFATTIDTSALAAAAAAAAAAAVAAVLQQGARSCTPAEDLNCYSTVQPQSAVGYPPYSLQQQVWGVSLQEQSAYEHLIRHSSTMLTAAESSCWFGSSLYQRYLSQQYPGSQDNLQARRHAAIAQVASSAAIASTAAHSATTLNQGQAVLHSQQQQQHPEQQLCAHCQMPNKSLQQRPELGIAPVLTESCWAADGLESPATVWHDCSSEANVFKA